MVLHWTGWSPTLLTDRRQRFKVVDGETFLWRPTRISIGKYDDSVQPVLCDKLHWLLVEERVNCKIALLTYKAYSSDMLVPVSANSASRRNRSADRGHLTIPRVKSTKYGGRSFAIAGQHCGTLCRLSFAAAYQCQFSVTWLKTCLFRAAYKTSAPTATVFVVKHPGMLAEAGGGGDI